MSLPYPQLLSRFLTLPFVLSNLTVMCCVVFMLLVSSQFYNTIQWCFPENLGKCSHHFFKYFPPTFRCFPLFQFIYQYVRWLSMSCNIISFYASFKNYILLHSSDCIIPINWSSRSLPNLFICHHPLSTIKSISKFCILNIFLLYNIFIFYNTKFFVEILHLVNFLYTSFTSLNITIIDYLKSLSSKSWITLRKVSAIPLLLTMDHISRFVLFFHLCNNI